MARLNNPFVVYGYKGAEYFCDRHLPATSSVRTALKALVDKQLVSKTPTGYLVSDRFFAKWLVGGGIIAN